MTGGISIAIDVLADAALDTLYLVPFLFVTYLAMEWLEHKAGDRTQQAMRRAGAAGPVVGAVVGAVPQCGFSAAAATLYAGRVVTLGTLVAVFLSTSDEMLPIFIAAQVPLGTMARVVGAKIAVGLVAGLLVDATMRALRRPAEPVRIHDLCEQDHCHCHDAHGEDGHVHGGGTRVILRSALSHTLQVTAFVFLVSLALDAAVELVGQDALAAFLGASPMLSVLASALVGLIPNCAASVVIAQLYVEGLLGAGALFAGLLVGAGVGLLVLLRTNRPIRQNVAIIALVYVIGVACGLVVNALGVTF